MGLDQYLYAKKYVSNGEWNKPEEREKYASIIKVVEAEDFPIGGFASAFVSLQVAYWRKQNGIHHWFVLNCQNGEDDCRDAYVSREQLTELRELVQEVLTDNSKADELLPTQGGFFFGSTDYDEWYFDGLRYTAEALDEILKKVPQDWDFYYHSSW